MIGWESKGSNGSENRRWERKWNGRAGCPFIMAQLENYISSKLLLPKIWKTRRTYTGSPVHCIVVSKTTRAEVSTLQVGTIARCPTQVYTDNTLVNIWEKKKSRLDQLGINREDFRNLYILCALRVLHARFAIFTHLDIFVWRSLGNNDVNWPNLKSMEDVSTRIWKFTFSSTFLIRACQLNA